MQYGRPDRFNARECRPPYVPRCSFRRKMRPASNSSRARPLNLKTEHTGAQPSPTQLQASLSSAVVLCTNTAVAYSYGVLLLRCWSQGHPLLSSLLPSPLRPYCYETIAFCDLQLLYCCCKVGSQGLPPPPPPLNRLHCVQAVRFLLLRTIAPRQPFFLPRPTPSVCAISGLPRR